MRSQGQVRFIRISSRLQMFAASLAVGLLVAWTVTMAVMAIAQYRSTQERLSLLDREARVETSESRVNAYKRNIDETAQNLARRQDFIEKMVAGLPQDIKTGETVSDSSDEAAQTVEKVSALIPEAAALARIEARQLAFVENLTRFADRRAAQAAQRIRQLGMNPAMMLASLDDRSAQGGPLIALVTGSNGKLDPRFERLGVSHARMEALERGLAGIPQVMPASLEFISSGFGYRADPFTGGGAFHSGLDFRGPYGAPIYAAAAGTVSYAGPKQGYGHTIEIDHGNGLMTRYAHMSGYRARLGQPVAAGDVIGAIGNSGRSTGPHLHFEVRLNDRALNPRPFLEAAAHVFQEPRATAASQR